MTLSYSNPASKVNCQCSQPVQACAFCTTTSLVGLPCSRSHSRSHKQLWFNREMRWGILDAKVCMPAWVVVNWAGDSGDSREFLARYVTLKPKPGAILTTTRGSAEWALLLPEHYCMMSPPPLWNLVAMFVISFSHHIVWLGVPRAAQRGDPADRTQCGGLWIVLQWVAHSTREILYTQCVCYATNVSVNKRCPVEHLPCALFAETLNVDSTLLNEPADIMGPTVNNSKKNWNVGVVMFGNLDREQKPLLFTALCATLVCEVCVAYFARKGCKCSRFAQPAHCCVNILTGSAITLPFAVHAYAGLKKKQPK